MLKRRVRLGIESMEEITLATIKDHVGKYLGASDWITVDQPKIDQFAMCTGDRQWIHVDTERARKESPFGSTIGHGYLTLSLIAPLAMEMGFAPKDASAVFNYGLDKVKFITPVRCGDRVRLQLALVNVEPKDEGQVLIKSKATLEIENSECPALVAETLALVVPYTHRRRWEMMLVTRPARHSDQPHVLAALPATTLAGGRPT